MKVLAWMRRWARDGVNVMALKKGDRPKGWAYHAVTPDKLMNDDVPLGEIAELPRVKHVKRGSIYEVLGEGEVQISTASGRPERKQSARLLKEGDKLVVYRCEDDGKLWIRFPDEFEDGRFEVLS